MNKFIRPAARRPPIPQGVILKSRLDRRAKEKERAWKNDDECFEKNRENVENCRSR